MRRSQLARTRGVPLQCFPLTSFSTSSYGQRNASATTSHFSNSGITRRSGCWTGVVSFFSLGQSSSVFFFGCMLAVLITCVNDSSCTHTKIRHMDHHQLRPDGVAQALHQPSGGGTSALAPVKVTANKVRHTRGKYTVREEVVRRVEISHPCKLTRTAVKVTFPGMKKEVLVSFIGYKEPNLMFVNRCKGLCSSEAIGHVACVPTKRSWKKVNMQLKTRVLGHETFKEKFKELVLEEHEECACQCLTVTPAHCISPDLFNNETCSCSCDRSVYHRDRLQCEAYPGRVWDHRTCSCAREDEMVIPPSVGGSSGTAQVTHDDDGDGYHHVYPVEGGGDIGGGGAPPGLYDPPVPHHGCTECLNCLTLVGGVEGLRGPDDYVTRNSWTIVGSCGALILVLLVTTVFYWRKSKSLTEELEGSASSEEDGSSLRGGSASPKPPVGRPLLAALTVAMSEEDGDGNAKATKSGNKKSSITELEARELLLANSKDLAVAGNNVGNSHTRLSNSLGRGDRDDRRRHHHHNGPSSPDKTVALDKNGGARPASAAPVVSSSSKPLSAAIAHLTTTSGGASSKKASSSSTGAGTASARKKQKKQKKKKEEQAYIDADFLNAPDMIQSCYFEDDLDPNFVNHQKIGAAGGIS